MLRERARLKNTLYVVKKRTGFATAGLDGSHSMSAALAGNFAKNEPWNRAKRSTYLTGGLAFLGYTPYLTRKDE